VTITLKANVESDPKWEVWAHLNPKDDPRGAGESFIIGDGATRSAALDQARATLNSATAQLEELAQ
jgi:hypothetical protein